MSLANFIYSLRNLMSSTKNSHDFTEIGTFQIGIGHDTVDLAQSPPVDGVKQRQAKVMWEKSFQWGQTAVRFNDESYMSPYFLSFLDLDMAIQTLLYAFHTKDFDHSKMKCMKCLHSRPFFLSKKLSQDSAKFISTAVLSDFFFGDFFKCLKKPWSGQRP